MNEKHRKVLNRSMVEFCRSLEPLKILPHLISKEIMSSDDFENLNKTTTRQAMVISFVVTLQTRGPNAFQHFKEALLEHKIYEHLVTTIESNLNEYTNQEERIDQWQWTPMDVYQMTAFEDCKKVLTNKLPFEAACEHFVQAKLLKTENIDFMRELPEESNQRSVFIAYVRGRGQVAYELLLEFLTMYQPELGQELRKAEEKCKKKEKRFTEQVTFKLQFTTLEGYNCGNFKQINIVVVGRTGSGKSATANQIVGKVDSFLEGSSSSSVTKTVQKENVHFYDFEITVLDTPGLFDTSRTLSNKDIILEIMKTTLEFPQGVHLFLFVCRGDSRFTREEMETFNAIERYFGHDLMEHCLLVLTHASSFNEDATLQDYLKGNERLHEVYTKIGQKAIAVENNNDDKILITSERKREQLIHAIIDLVTINKGSVYSSKLFDASKKELEIERKRVKLNETIDNVTFRVLLFSGRNEFLWEDAAPASKHILERIESKLPLDEKSLLTEKDITSLIKISYNEQKDIIRNIIKKESTEADLMNTIRKNVPDKNFPTSIMHYVLEKFEKMKTSMLDKLGHNERLPAEETKEILQNSPFQIETESVEKVNECISKYIEKIVEVFHKINQRHELITYINCECSEDMKEYFRMISYSERRRIIYHFINAQMIPPDLHCKCLKSIPDRFKEPYWEATIDRVLYKTVLDRINTENAILKSVMLILKNSYKVLTSLFSGIVDILSDPTFEFGYLLDTGIKEYFSDYWEDDRQNYKKILKCKKCNGSHYEKKIQK